MKLKAKFTKRMGSFILDVNIDSDCRKLGFFGSSGSGKSMTLRCLAGIENPDK